MTKHAATQPRAKSRSRQRTPDKIWAVGLAGATCVGLVGTMGVRVAQEAVASTEVPDSPAVAVAYAEDQPAVSGVTSSGLTYEQLDQYARALEVERMRLETYHQELLQVAARLQESADALSQAGATIPANASKKAKKIAQAARETSNASAAQGQQVTKPVPKPAAAPQVVQPQAQTRGS